MSGSNPLSTRWYPPLGWSMIILAAAPFMAALQDRIQAWTGDSFRWFLIGGLVLVMVGGLAWAAGRIREHRLARWSALCLLAVLLGLQVAFFGRTDAEIGLVEKVHLVAYGWLALLVYRAARPLGDLRMVALPLLWVAALGSLDEWLQWLAPTRVGDWVDVALNVFAGVCGLLFALALFSPVAWHPAQPKVIASLSWGASGAVLLFATFFHQAHLGYRVDLQGDSSFISWHSRERLVQASRERARRWAQHAPGRLRLLAIEDVYRSEAAFHAQYRNIALSQGDLSSAWKENRILEIYFEPFLEYRPGHRWPAAQRKNVKEGRPKPDPPYASPVLGDRVFVRPSKAVFWSLVVSLALGLGLGGRCMARRRA